MLHRTHGVGPKAWPGGVAALLLAFSCAARAGDVIIEIDPASIVSPGQDAPTPLVEVSDSRETTALERATIGQVSLGQIEVVPPLPELVGAIVSARAAGIPVGIDTGEEPLVIYCDLRRFAIETPATLLYWDIKSRIDIVLRVGDREREISASATQRTWVYPSRQILEQVTREALVDLSGKLEPALVELLSAPLAEEADATTEVEAEVDAEPEP